MVAAAVGATVTPNARLTGGKTMDTLAQTFEELRGRIARAEYFELDAPNTDVATDDQTVRVEALPGNDGLRRVHRKLQTRLALPRAADVVR